jgi:cytidylate kinase
MEDSMTVIAMTREMGSLGKDVAAGLADQMGLTVVHHELVEHNLAERLGVQESAVHRYLEGGASLFERWKIDKEKLSRYTADEILELAKKGNVVIRGWGAVAILRAVPHVLRVRVCAPMPSRERVMVERLGLKSPSEAMREILQNDAAHARIMRGFFGVNWEDPQLYHVVLNTGAVPVDACVSIVRLLAERPEFKVTDETRSVLADKLMESRVRAALGDAFATPITVKVAMGKVTLTGTTMSPVSNVEELVRSVPGVTEVENRIVVVRSGAA